MPESADPLPPLVDQLLLVVENENGDVDTAVAAIVTAADRLRAVCALGERLVDLQESVTSRRQTAYALRLLGLPEALPYLGQALLKDNDQGVRRLSLGALEQIDLAQSLTFFEKALTDPTADIRESALASFGLAVRELALIIQDERGPQADAAAQRLRELSLDNLNRLLRQDLSRLEEQKLPPPEAAAVALSARGAEAIQPLCRFLEWVQEAHNRAEREGDAADPEARQRELDHDRNRDRVLLAAVEALTQIGQVEAVPCLGKTLRHYRNFRVRRAAAGSLRRLGYEEAIPHLVFAFLEDQEAEVRSVAKTSLTSYDNWRAKADQTVQLLRDGRQQRGQIDALAIVSTLQPPEAELRADPHLLTDYFIGQALDHSDDERLLALLAALIIACADSSMSLAAERLDAYRQSHNVKEERLQPLRLEIGGAKALAPITSRLEQSLIDYFQNPILELNKETSRAWQRIIYIAHLGFALRALLSVVLFGIGAYITLVSFNRLLAGTLNVDQLFGPGISFVAGLATMAITVFTGPLKEIRQAVDDVGAANAAFIAYIHRVLQVSHTFSYYYMENKMTFAELENASRLIEATLANTISNLRHPGDSNR